MTHEEHARLARKCFELATEPPPTMAERKQHFWSAANYHATMAVYEALILPGYGMSLGENEENKRERGFA